MLWLKVFHLIFMVSWFAGVFYLPRLFVYHAMSNEPAVHAQLAIMERKLYRFVSIFAVLTVVLGLALTWPNLDYYRTAGWYHAKLGLVVALVAYHFVCGVQLRKLADNPDLHSHVFYRWFNEIPLLLLVGIIVLVVVKPF